nr:MAG TPA: hypothetical protein [Caudoviricetes sp.]
MYSLVIGRDKPPDSQRRRSQMSTVTYIALCVARDV